MPPFVPSPPPARFRLRAGVGLLLALALCVLTGWGVREFVLARQLDLLSQQSRHHVDFYRTSLEFLLSRNESLPRVIAMEACLKTLLRDPSDRKLQEAANRYLLDVKNRADINATFLMDRAGLTVASSNFGTPSSYVGQNYGYRPYFQTAMRGGLGRFYGVGATTGEPGFFLAAPIEERGAAIGTVIVKISLEDFEAALIGSGDPVLLVDAHGVIFLASVPELKYHFLMPLEAGVLQQIGLSRQYDNQHLRPLGMNLRLQEGPQTVRAELPGRPAQEYLAQSVKAGSLGWSIVLLAQTRQERQNALLAGIAAGFAVALALSVVIFFQLNLKRYNERRQAEAALRQAHFDLERRIAERTADLTATNASLEEKVEALRTTEGILRETRDAAVQAGKLAVLGQMAAGISHEVNQPLTALHTFTDNAVSLLDMGRTDDVRENLGFIKQMAVRMEHIVGEIKHFARKPVAERRIVVVADVVRQALALVESKRRELGARFTASAAEAGVSVWADPQRLEQVLVNLLLNGLDAVAEAKDRQVDIAVAEDGDRVAIVVRDHGPGIPPEVLPHLFEPFFTTKNSGKGLGLGLAISRMIVAGFGGRIEARNRDDGGAEFVVTLEKA